MDTQLETRIIAVMASVTKLKPEEIRVDASFDELGIDSLDRINILFELESEFDIDIPDEEARRIKTVGEMIERLEPHLQRVGKKGA
jgi:acyl carrier protein